MRVPAAVTAAFRRTRRRLPQRVRTRLALIYAGLFFVSGSALLGLTYGLVASSLPAYPQGKPAAYSSEQLAKLEAACRLPAADPGTKERCARVYAAGADAGSQTQRARSLHELLVFSLLGLGVTTVTSGGLGWVMAGRVLRPVRAITLAARRASGQHLGERLALTGPRDEIRELADTFDDMLERLDRAFAMQRRFVGDASHELRTPLTVMRTAIDVTLAKPGRTAGQLEDMAARVRRSITRAEAMIDGLLTLAVSDQGRTGSEFADLATAAEDALDAVAPALRERGLRVEARLEPAGMAGDPPLLERLVANLVENAVRHNEPGGWLAVATGTAEGAAFVEVANGGAVIPEADVPSLFQPFRRLGDHTGADGGAGLGLAIVQSVATAHQARVSASARPGGGLAIRVVVPLQPGVAARPPVSDPDLTSPRPARRAARA